MTVRADATLALALLFSLGSTGCLRFFYEPLSAVDSGRPDAGFDAGSAERADGGSTRTDAGTHVQAGSGGSARDAAALDASTIQSDAASNVAGDAAADGGSDSVPCSAQPPESHRLEIIDNQVIGGPHADFPLLISLQADWLRSGSVVDPQGADLRFALDGTGSAALVFEIESYDPMSGALTAWVRMPTLDTGSVVYILFGSCAAQLPIAPGSVWQSYKAVWHLGDNREASARSADAVEEGSVPVAAGKIGSGRAFSSTGGAFNTGSSAAIDDVFANGGFMSAWVNPSALSSGSAGRIASKVTPFSLNSDGWALLLDPNPAGSLIFRYHFAPNLGYWVTPSGSVPLGSWHLVVVQYSSASDQENPQIFVDGQLIALGNGQAPSGSPVSDASSTMYIGNIGDGSRPFDGTIDELRLGHGTKTAGWITTEFNNQQDPSGFYVVD